MASVKGVFKELWWFRSTIIMIGVPLLLALMLPFSEQMGMSQKACNCLYMLLLMAIYWITETFHLSVTSLIPLVLSPMLSIQTAPDIAKNYFKDVGTLYLGGLMVAAAIEHSQLHRRMALSILKLCGTNPRFLMLGFMIPSWFLSMWISNSATAAMMVTIALAVISQLEESEKQLYRKSLKKNTNSLKLNNNDVEIAETGVDDADSSTGVDNPGFDPETKPDSQSADDLNKNNTDSLSSDGDSDAEDDEFEGKWVEMGKGILMATAYSASIGGIATITGTFSNLIFQENLASISKEALGNHDFGVRFATWIGFGMPISIVMLFLAWIVLQIVFIGIRCNVQSEEQRTQIQNIIDTAYNGLGPMKFKEVVAVIHFAMLALLWIGRNPGGSGGWGSLFTEGYVSDGTAAVFVVLSMFMWPGELPDFCCSRGGCGVRKRVSRKPFITWNELAQKVQWGLLMLLGGGFALADSITVSGLSKVLGEALNFFDGWPVWGVVVCLSAITSLLTEITTNAAISTIFMPIAARMAVDVQMNPVYFMLPVCVGASYSFMLPVATGPNALVYASGRLSIKDMVKAGWILNILGVGVATLFTLTWSQVVFKMDNISFNNTVNFNLTSNI